MEQLEILNTSEAGPDIVIGKPTTHEEATEMFTGLDMIRGQAFIAQGYILRVVKDERLYQAAGCLDIYQYAARYLDIKDDSIVNRYMNINKRFSQNGYSPFISNEYRYYKYSVLAEIWRMTDEEIAEAGITETTTRARIREIKKEAREANAEPEIREQVQGQLSITDVITDSGEIQTAPAQEDSPSEKDKELEILSEFAKEYYENYMDKKQHELLEEGKEDEAALYTKERLLPFFDEKKDVLHYSINTGRIEISPDGYVKLKDNKVRSWRDVYLRIEILKILGDLTDIYSEGAFKKYLKDLSCVVGPEELITYKMARDMAEELENLSLENIPEEVGRIQEMIKTEYECADVVFQCGFNIYLAELQGEEMSVTRTNTTTCQPEARNIFTIKIYDLAQEIHRIKNKDKDKGCDRNCFYCNTEEDCNAKQNKRENCIYDNTRKCHMYAAHEEALNSGIDCTSDCCNRCDIKDCAFKCSYAKTQESTENVINATEKDSSGEKTERRQQDIFENNSEPYGFVRSKLVKSLFEHLQKLGLEMEDVSGELAIYSYIRRYAYISQDKMYVEFIEAAKDDRDEAVEDVFVDFKISMERLKEEYMQYRENNPENVINTTEEDDSDSAAVQDMTEITEGVPEIERLIANDIVENIRQDASDKHIEDIIKNAASFLKYMHKQFDSDAWSYVKYKKEYYEWETFEDDPFMYVYKIKGCIGGWHRTGEYFRVLLNEFASFAISEYSKNHDTDIKNDEPEEKTELEAESEEIIEAEVITEQTKPYYVPESENARDKVINNVMYNDTRGQDADGEPYTCPPNRKPCDEKCDWKPYGQTCEEKTGICSCCWQTYIKELIEKDRNGEITQATAETTVEVNSDTIAEQKELPRLKNNEQRKEWIEKFEEWPLWIDNKETQEKFYRYTFENGDSFVIRQAFSNLQHWNYVTGKMEKDPGWRHEKYFIVKKEEDRTLSDSETSISIMVEYLKDMQKKGSR